MAVLLAAMVAGEQLAARLLAVFKETRTIVAHAVAHMTTTRQRFVADGATHHHRFVTGNVGHDTLSAQTRTLHKVCADGTRLVVWMAIVC
jgi:hypothetical protein